MKHTKAMVVNFRKDWEGNDEFRLFPFLMTGYVKVNEIEVSFEVPDDFNPVAAQLEILHQKRHELVRQFTQAIDEVKEQISKLESLEYSEAA